MVVVVVVEMLDEEGSSVIAPRLLDRVKDDLDNVAALLADGETGAVTQLLQDDVESSMRGVLDAFRRRLEDEKKRRREEEENEESGAALGQLPGAGGMPAGSEEEIVPPSTEVKMLFAEQERLRQRTQRLAGLGVRRPDEEPREGDGALDEKKQQLLFSQAKRLALAEESLSRLTQAFIERFEMIDPLLLGLDPRETQDPSEPRAAGPETENAPDQTEDFFPTIEPRENEAAGDEAQRPNDSEKEDAR